MDDTSQLSAAASTLQALSSALATMEYSGPIYDAMSTELDKLGQEMQAGVLQTVPVGETGALRDSVKPIRAKGRLGLALVAGVINAKGYNYGWFTELGTDEAAGHAVDKIGYRHVGNRPAPEHWTGIAAMHWFSGPTDTVIAAAPERLHAAMASAVQSILSH